MRSFLLAAALLLPAPLLSQFPAPGAYKMVLHPVGQEGTIPLSLIVKAIGDSTALAVEQGPEQAIPVTSYFATRPGFAIGIAGQFQCRFAKGDTQWDGLCTDTWEAPMFTASFPLSAEAAAPPK